MLGDTERSQVVQQSLLKTAELNSPHIMYFVSNNERLSGLLKHFVCHNEKLIGPLCGDFMVFSGRNLNIIIRILFSLVYNQLFI